MIGIFVMILAQASCTNTEVASGVGGFIRAADTGQPIPNARVVSSRAGEASIAKTGHDGFFGLKPLRSRSVQPDIDPNEVHLLTVSADGYKPAIRRFVRPEGAELPIPARTVTVELEPTNTEQA